MNFVMLVKHYATKLVDPQFRMPSWPKSSDFCRNRASEFSLGRRKKAAAEMPGKYALELERGGQVFWRET